MAAGLRVNGKSLRSLGLHLEGTPGFSDMPGRRVVATEVPSHFGAYVSRIDGGPARRLRIEASLVRDTVAARVSTEDRLKALFDGGLHRIEREVGGVTRVTYGYLDGDPVWEAPRLFLRPVTTVRLTLFCPDPFWRSLNGVAVAVNTTTGYFALPTGTGPVAPRIRVMGAATTPIVRIRDAWASLRSEIALPTLTSTEWLDLDYARGSVERVSSGTRTSVLSSAAFTTGAWPLPIDSTYIDYENGRWATVSVSSGSAEVLYTPRWL
jgi:hypothetical protein